MKKLALVIVLVFAFTLTALANPFVDVPLNHWAYDAVQSLSAKGIIVGYPDGTFGGAKSLTRYEFAEAVGKALAFVEAQGFATAEEVVILEKLAIEFADELASLGVTVADLEAALGANSEAIAVLEGKVATLETFFEPVVITGSSEVSYELPSDTGVGVLTDTTTLNIVATINDETTAGVSVTIEDAIAGGAAASWDSFFIDYQGDKAQLRFGDVEPATIALGLIYDFDVTEGFDGALMTWNMMDGAWAGFTRVDDFYTVHADFGDFGVTASYDKLASAIVGGADITYALNEDTTLVIEGAAFYATAFDYAVAATLGTEFADLTFALDGHYVTAGFTPVEGGFDADRMGGGVTVGFIASEDVTLDITYAYDKPRVGVAVTNEVSGELGLTFSDIDVTLTGGYDLLTGAVPAGVVLAYDKLTVDVSTDDVLATPIAFVAIADYIGYALTDDITFDLTYQFDSAVAEHTATATLNYTYSDVLGVVFEGRYDTIPTGGVPYSVELTLTHALATNTELVVGYELNDWDGDADVRDILDDVGTLSAVLTVSF